MLRVGLTGGIASGKSHVLRGLAAAGFGAMDLDSISHEIVETDRDAEREVVEAFGPSVVGASGRIDRHALGEVVFASREARERLNAILHPRIRSIEERRTLELAAVSDVVVTDGALLIESGGHLRFDRLIVVHCPEAMQAERLARRDGLEAEAARLRIAAQMKTEEKRRFASFEIDTSGATPETDRQVARLAQRLLHLRGATRPFARLTGAQIGGCLRWLPEVGPRGLRTGRVLCDAARARRLDLAHLAAQLVPTARGAWYEGADEAPSGGGVESLGLVVALWCLASRALDAEYTLAAAAAVARLTDRDSGSIAGACLLAEAALTVARGERVPGDWRGAWSGWRREAAKWGSASVSPEMGQALDAVAGCPDDVDGARRAAGTSQRGAATAAALVGLRVGSADLGGLSEELRAACQALDVAESQRGA